MSQVLDHWSAVLMSFSSCKEEKLALAIFNLFSFSFFFFKSQCSLLGGEGRVLAFSPLHYLFLLHDGLLSRRPLNPLVFFAGFKQVLKLVLEPIQPNGFMVPCSELQKGLSSQTMSVRT